MSTYHCIGTFGHPRIHLPQYWCEVKNLLSVAKSPVPHPVEQQASKYRELSNPVGIQYTRLQGLYIDGRRSFLSQRPPGLSVWYYIIKRLTIINLYHSLSLSFWSHAGFSPPPPPLPPFAVYCSRPPPPRHKTTSAWVRASSRMCAYRDIYTHFLILLFSHYCRLINVLRTHTHARRTYIYYNIYIIYVGKRIV